MRGHLFEAYLYLRLVFLHELKISLCALLVPLSLTLCPFFDAFIVIENDNAF